MLLDQAEHLLTTGGRGWIVVLSQKPQATAPIVVDEATNGVIDRDAFHTAILSDVDGPPGAKRPPRSTGVPRRPVTGR